MSLLENPTPLSATSGSYTLPTSVDVNTSSTATADATSPDFTIPPANKSNMIIISVVIENIKTYTMLDTGSTFSTLTPNFAACIKAKITPASGVVQLGYANSQEARNVFSNRNNHWDKYLTTE
ncbi:hypothetical protein BD770DRAFT_450260 [Pilaira anomala]|nr:hypothetical protein BD770DRAFT_450260 [Pilaira anomala]